MTYLINDIFYTIQGEGHWTGRPAIFVRFSRCNLWTGKEPDRHRSICTFCDTDFTDYRDMNLSDVLSEIESCWPGGTTPMVVFTGGEPALQLDCALVHGLRSLGYYLAIETNGTRPFNCGLLDWVCVSPKTRRLRIRAGNELKLVFPQERVTPEHYKALQFDHFWLSPMDGPNLAANTKAAIDYVMAHPQWRLNIQTHKVIGVK